MQLTRATAAPERRLSVVAGLLIGTAFALLLGTMRPNRPARIAPPRLPEAKAFKVCGNYCGDNWCSGQVIRESECGDLTSLAEPEHCYDACCKAHDFCCVPGEVQTDCNKNIVACVQACHNQSSSLQPPAHTVDVDLWAELNEVASASLAFAMRGDSNAEAFLCGKVLGTAMSAMQECECGLCPMLPKPFISGIEAVEEYLSPGTLRERERSNAVKAKTSVRPSRPWWVNLGRSM